MIFDTITQTVSILKKNVCSVLQHHYMYISIQYRSTQTAVLLHILC